MKKYVALTLSLLLAAALFTGCGAKTVKTGLGVVSSISSSTEPTADKAGNAQVDSTVAAVLVDSDGKIVNCKIDVAQTKIAFDATGAVTTPLDNTYQTKQELKEGYNMKGASGIGKEWYEQADAFAAYVIGKTVDDVKGIALTEDGKPSGADLTSSVTIHAGDFIAAVVKAVSNAQDLGATAGDTLGLGVTTNISSSTNAAADKDGTAQAYSHYTATTFDKSGKITSCYIDASQTNIGISVAGKITTDLKSEFQTKQEKKEGYNMKGSSGIGKEWYEQANAFAKYVTGKTVDDVKGIALSEGGEPTGADLTSSVTIHVTDFIGVIGKAAATATAAPAK